MDTQKEHKQYFERLERVKRYLDGLDKKENESK